MATRRKTTTKKATAKTEEVAPETTEESTTKTEEETFTAPESSSDFKTVALEDITADYELNPRSEDNYDPVNISSLGQDIAFNGLKEPIVVNKDMRIIAGFRRYTACKFAEKLIAKKTGDKDYKMQIPIIVREVEEGSLSEEIIAHQIQNKPFSLPERITAIRTLNESKSIKEIAKVFACSEASIKKDLLIASLPQEVVEEVCKGDFHKSNLHSAGQFYSKFKKKSKQDEAIRAATLSNLKKFASIGAAEFQKVLSEAVKKITIQTTDKKDLSAIQKQKAANSKTTSKKASLEDLLSDSENEDILSQISKKGGKSKENKLTKLIEEINQPRKLKSEEEIKSTLETVATTGAAPAATLEFILKYIFVLDDNSSEDDELESLIDDEEEDSDDDIFS